MFSGKKKDRTTKAFFDVQRPASGIEDKNLTEEVLQPQHNKNKERYFEKRKI